jgi:sugar phosphate permease
MVLTSSNADKINHSTTSNINTFPGLINVIAYGTQLTAKFSSGVIVDLYDAPKRIFIFTLLLAIILTLVNTVWDSAAGFIFIASSIKYLCAFGRVGILKIVALWWPKHLMGTMGAVINIW